MIWLILTLGLILRLISLNQSFWLDEATSATVVKTLNFGEIITKFAPGDFHPPFYYLLLKIWTIPFGVSEISTRSLSVLLSLLTIYVVYLIGKKIKNKAFGETAAILIATAPLFVYYSQEARMYALETFLVSLLVYFFIAESWVFFSLVLVLVGATDYLPLLVVPAFWIWGAVKKKNLNWFTRLAASHLPLALFFAWWAPYFALQLSAGLSVKLNSPGWWQVLGKAGLKEAVLLPIKFVIGRINFDNKAVYGAIAISSMALYSFLIVKSIKVIKKYQLLAYWLIIPVLLAFVLSFKLSVFSYFRLLFVLPAFYFIASLGLYNLKKNLFPIFFLTLVFLNTAFSLVYLLNPKFQREDWRGVAKQISNSPVVFPAKSQREAFLYYNSSPNIVEPEKLNRNLKELYLMRYVQDIFDPEDKVRLKIEELGYKKVNDFNFNGVVVWKYEK